MASGSPDALFQRRKVSGSPRSKAGMRGQCPACRTNPFGFTLMLGVRDRTGVWTPPVICGRVVPLRNENRADTNSWGPPIWRSGLYRLGASARRVSDSGEADGCGPRDTLYCGSAGNNLPGDRRHGRLRFSVDYLAIARAAKGLQALNLRCQGRVIRRTSSSLGYSSPGPGACRAKPNIWNPALVGPGRELRSGISSPTRRRPKEPESLAPGSRVERRWRDELIILS